MSFVLGLSACACAQTESDVRLRIYNWWGGNEKAPFAGVINAFVAKHPNIAIDNPTNFEAKSQRDQVANDLLVGNPPSAFQANLGSDLLQWAEVTTTDGTHSLISDLSKVLPKGFANQLHPHLIEGASTGAHQNLLAVPLNVHRINMVYFDQKQFQRLFPGRDTFLGIDELCPADPENTERLTFDIAIGCQDDFSLTLLTFEAVLPALAGGDFYNRVMAGEEPDGYVDKLKEALACVRYLSRSFVNTTDEWDDALLLRVGEPGALFTVTGDWANLQIGEKLASHEMIGVPFPGSEDTFVFTSDTFALPLGAPHAEEAKEFLRFMAQSDVQTAFSNDKGSIPAIKDARIGGALLAERNAAREAYDTAKYHSLAMSGLFPPNYPRTPLVDRLKEMVAPRSTPDTIVAALNEFVAAQELRRIWQARLAQQ